MQFLNDQWKNPASRYGFLGAIAAFSLVGSLSTLPWLAVFGASAGIGLVLSVGIQVISYFKSISDEAKHTLQGLNNTLEEAKRAVSRVSQEFEDAPKGQPPTIIQNVRGMISIVNKEMGEAPKNEPPTMMQNVKAAISEAKDAVVKVNKELGEAPAGEEPTLAQKVKSTIGEVNETVDQGRSGWAGWFLNLNKQSAPANKAPAPKVTEKASEPEAVEKSTARKKKLTETEKRPTTKKTMPKKALRPVSDEEVDEAAINELLATFDDPAPQPSVRQGWGEWATSWIPSFSKPNGKNVEPLKATPKATPPRPALRKSTRVAATKR